MTTELRNRFLEHLFRLQRGEDIASRDFACPACGGAGHVQAIMAKEGSRKGTVAVSMWCSNCDGGFEADGIEPWPGWEQIRMPESERIDPKLSFTEIRRRHRLRQEPK
jgi:hypothetical protein